MKNKGFSLVELLAVIIILSVIVTISTPIVISSINTSKEKAYENQLKMIEDAARRWMTDNSATADEKTIETADLQKVIRITVNELQNEGYLNRNKIKNPKTGKEMKGCIIISEDINYHQYTYEYLEEEHTLCS